MTETIHVDWQPGDTVTALVYRAPPDHRMNRTIVLGHGAGAGQTHPFMVDFAHGLGARGVDVVTFNFPYMEHGRRMPDRRDRLEACYAAVLRRVLDLPMLAGSRPFVGGKSMGGRMATYMVAGLSDELRARIGGVVLLGYPLHPPGRPERLRASHLGDVRVPMLFVQGDRDTFGGPDELERALTGVETATIQPVVGGDHSFKVPVRSGRTRAEVFAEVQDGIVSWMDDVEPSA